MRLRSLTAAAYVRVLLVLIVLGTAAIGIAYLVAHSEVEKASDRNLTLGAHMLYALMQEELAASQNGEFPTSLLSSEDRLAIRTGEPTRMFVISRHGQVIARSENAPTNFAIPLNSGFHNFGSDRWRSYGLEIPRYDMLIVMGTRYEDIDRGLTTFLHKFAIPFDFLVIISVLALWGMLHGGLADMRRLNKQLARRSFHDLKPLIPADWPRELHTLIGTLNRLFARVQAGIEHEQTFTDAAAHQLRTPLAALRLQAEVLARDEGIAHERTKPLMDCVDHAHGLVTRILLLSRLGATTAIMTRFNLPVLVSDSLARHALVASQRGMSLSCENRGVESIVSDSSLLDIALSSLFENAMTHAVSGGALDVLLLREEQDVRIDIMDRGPGIPASRRAEVFGRFYQINATAGHGLGLSIVADALSLINAKIELADRADGSGLHVSIIIPNSE